MDDNSSSAISTHELYYEAVYSHISRFEPQVNALTRIKFETAEEASTEAKGLDHTALRGLPVIIKDTLKTKDMPTTAGSTTLKNYQPSTDAEVVKRIRQQGGLIFAKSNTPEFGLDFQTHNELFGITSNPFNHELTAGGSSGGSAAAIAAGYSDFAIGSDLGGSLRQPASFCGVVSLRPTLGIVPDHGQLPENEQNHITVVGPMGSTVEMTSRLFDAMLGQSFQPLTDITLSEVSVLFASSLDEIPIQHSIVNTLEIFGSKIKEISGSVTQIRSFPEFERYHPVYLGLLDLFQGMDPDHDLQYYLNMQSQLQEELTEFIGGNDLFILPVSSVQPYPHNLNHDKLNVDGRQLNYWVANSFYCRIASVTGFPVVTLPIAYLDGIPLGVQLIGHLGSDKKLLAIALAIEQILSESTER